MNKLNIKPDIQTFRIITPADGDGQYRLMLGHKVITSKTLKIGVLNLFNQFKGISDNGYLAVNELYDFIIKYPQSYQQTLILNILRPDGPGTPRPTSDHHHTLSEAPELPSPPATEGEVAIGNVTHGATPVKVPYRKKGQSTIYDPLIDAAIELGGSSRAISRYLLEKHSLIISHMSIKRRIDEKSEVSA